MLLLLLLLLLLCYYHIMSLLLCYCYYVTILKKFYFLQQIYQCFGLECQSEADCIVPPEQTYCYYSNKACTKRGAKCSWTDNGRWAPYCHDVNGVYILPTRSIKNLPYYLPFLIQKVQNHLIMISILFTYIFFYYMLLLF